MRSRFGIVTALGIISLFSATLAIAPPAAAQMMPYCPPGQPARFVYGIAALDDRLGTTMGTPLECEHINPDNGDTLQHTTTGLAYYRPSINTPMFTNGQTHWALTNNEVVMWRNPSVVPPQPTAAEAAFLRTTTPLQSQLDELQGRLSALQQRANAGRLDDVDVADIGALFDQLASVRDTFAETPASARLQPYDDTMQASTRAAATSAELLLRARLTDIGAARDAFIAAAAERGTESRQLQRQAIFAFSQALPIVTS
ncbi:MAG: hypothetical protein IT305_01850 [Chloroflexi bacterium]|nr:hypothetical protein [Chloroflexota bacterium]